MSDRVCAVLERTADGIAVGRCWYRVNADGFCLRHGDVRHVQARFSATGKLTDERDLRAGTDNGKDGTR